MERRQYKDKLERKLTFNFVRTRVYKTLLSFMTIKLLNSSQTISKHAENTK